MAWEAVSRRERPAPLRPPEGAPSASRFPLRKAFRPGGNPSSREKIAKPAGRDARRPTGVPKMAALEEAFTLSAVPLGAGPGGLLGVEQSHKTDQFLITDGGRTVILYKVRAMGPARRRRRARSRSLASIRDGGEGRGAGLAECRRGLSATLRESENP